jgi:hypothetical protein
MLQKCETRLMRVMHIKAGNGLKKVKSRFQSGLDFYDFQTQIGCNGFQNPIAHKHARTKIGATPCLDRAATGQLNRDEACAN